MTQPDKILPLTPVTMIGHRVNVTCNKKRHQGEGVIEDFDHNNPVCTISTEKGEFRGVRFKVRRDDGGYFWTVSLPDYSRPVGPDLRCTSMSEERGE